MCINTILLLLVSFCLLQGCIQPGSDAYWNIGKDNTINHLNFPLYTPATVHATIVCNPKQLSNYANKCQ